MWGTTGCDIVVIGWVIVRTIVRKIGRVGDGNGVDGDDGSDGNRVILEVARTHQILSYGLLFLTFYHFLYTAGPPTSTTPMRPSPTFVRSLPTIPYTHRTIGLVPRQRPLI